MATDAAAVARVLAEPEGFSVTHNWPAPNEDCIGIGRMTLAGERAAEMFLGRTVQEASINGLDIMAERIYEAMVLVGGVPLTDILAAHAAAVRQQARQEALADAVKAVETQVFMPEMQPPGTGPFTREDRVADAVRKLCAAAIRAPAQQEPDHAG